MTVKYMGSKRAMLKNGLGRILKRQIVQIGGTNRFFDLFAGSGAVAVHVAQQFNVPVLAFDLQSYSAVITNAVISRQTKLDWALVWEEWHQNAQIRFAEFEIPNALRLTIPSVAEFREWCGNQVLPITKAYGGHYFSPQQSVWIDSLRVTLPENNPCRIVALAALIQAASHSAASPGHTAQPFQPTDTAKKHLEKAWAFNVVTKTKSAFEELSGQVAKQIGSAFVGDAIEAAEQLTEGDLAFIDPPYSGEHYSRFYHVLETIAAGECGEVSGVGRYPSSDLRPRSSFSLKSESEDALDDLLETISRHGAKAILTFPDHECSNGLSGDLVTDIASEHFHVKERFVESSFSTMGGTGITDDMGRHPRQRANELILVLKPK